LRIIEKPSRHLANMEVLTKGPSVLDSLREICLYVSSATELITQRSSAFANIRRVEEEAVPKNGSILADMLDELEYTTTGTIRTIPDSTFNKKSH
jgi:hypothetical protein